MAIKVTAPWLSEDMCSLERGRPLKGFSNPHKVKISKLLLEAMKVNSYFEFIRILSKLTHPLFFLFQYWLDVDKQMSHQIGLSPGGRLQEPLLRFCVKFYTPDPAFIEEEYTRYLFSLQVKRDLATGSLQVNDNTAALMASYIVQGRH